MSGAQVMPLRPTTRTVAAESERVVDLVIKVRSQEELEAILVGLLEELRRRRA